MRLLRLVLSVLVLATTAHAQATEKIIRNLNTPRPNGGLVFDQQGNLYGTTSGLQGKYGTVFKLHPYSASLWGDRLLYAFLGGADGMYPNSRPVFDASGNLYGAATGGGTHSCPLSNYVHTCGIVFELMPTPTGQWTKKVIYDFEGISLTGTDGFGPSSGVIFDSAGNLYGETGFGGRFHGTVYELVHGADGSWTEKILYSFTGGTDGAGPSGGLTRDTAGNLYGTTWLGGAKASGTLFELSPASDGTWTFHLLHTFCSRTGCADGASPHGVVLDKSGNLYGATTLGGIVPCWWDAFTFSQHPAGCGTVFKLSRGLNGGWNYSVLHSFCPIATCPDGGYPNDDLAFDGGGNLYGATGVAGGHLQGTVFKLSHPTGSPWVLNSLYSFCALSQCADGYGPSGSLALDGAGNLYGTTIGGAKAFEIIP